jgi:biopolymer transport protein ExbD
MKAPIKVVMACVATAACVFGAMKIATAQRSRNVPLSMTVNFVPPADCEISFAGQTFSLPIDEDSMVAALQKLRRDWRSISMTGVMQTPYRCIGHAIYLAQRAGFKKIGFAAEPSHG